MFDSLGIFICAILLDIYYNNHYKKYQADISNKIKTFKQQGEVRFNLFYKTKHE